MAQVRISTKQSKPKVSNDNPWAWGSANPGQIWTDTAKNFSQALSHGAQQIGDFFGSIPGGGPIQGFANLFNPPKAQPKKKSTPKPSTSTPKAPVYTAPNYLDALAQAQALMGGQSAPTVDYSPLIQQTQQTYGDASNRLLAMYNALHNNFQNDAGNIGGIFDQAKTASQQAADQATGDINNAYDAARAAQTKQFNDLGIGEALAAITANGEGTMGADQANALSRAATSNQANQNQLDTNKSAALNYNTGIANSALQGGTDRAAQLQSQLAQAVAQIRQQQATANSQLASAQAGNVTDLASQIYSSMVNGQKLTDAEKQQAVSNILNSNKTAAQQQSDYVTSLVNLIKSGKSPQEAQAILSGAGY